MTVVLLNQAPLLLSEDTDDVIDVDILEKHLPVFKELSIPFLLEQNTRSRFSLDPDFQTPAQSSSHVPTGVSNKGSRPETSIPIFSCVVLWSCRISSMDAIGLSRSTSGDLCLRVLSSSFRKTLENQDEPLKRSGLRWDWAPERTR